MNLHDNLTTRLVALFHSIYSFYDTYILIPHKITSIDNKVHKPVNVVKLNKYI